MRHTIPIDRTLTKHDLAALLDVPLRDLGDFDPLLAGIFCPEPEIGVEKIGITRQFLEDADTYHARYSNAGHFSRLFREAFEQTGLSPGVGSTILDIGTGSGLNTIEPCLKLFDDCRIVATDLSSDLLRMLRRHVVTEDLEQRVACVCTDAMRDYFTPSCFDTVVGAAILHHLLDPGQALATVHRVLKPGGIALFFEPFEGLSLLRIAFDLILDRAKREVVPLDPATATLLTALCLDYATRAGSDKSAPHFQHMDDKWLFTRTWLEGAARRAGFDQVAIVPHSFHDTLFRDYTVGVLRLGAGLAPEALPPWAWDTIATFDRGFSPEMKRDVLLEGTIVLRKT